MPNIGMQMRMASNLEEFRKTFFYSVQANRFNSVSYFYYMLWYVQIPSEQSRAMEGRPVVL